MRTILNAKEHEIYSTVDSYAKIYPNLTKLITYKQPIQVREAGWEAPEKEYKPRSTGSMQSQIDSLRRTKTRLSDIVLANRFSLFCTFTFATERSDVARCKSRMSHWLDNQNTRVGKFKYLIVPEFHKDGVSIHFHALFKDYNGNLVDSGHKRSDGRVVYNIPGYKFGFSTATKIDEEGIPKVSSYIKKYITKDMPQFENKKRYWCSHDLIRPDKVQNPLLFPEDELRFTESYDNNGFNVRISHERVDLISRDTIARA
jgi:hypothetical protein